MTPSPEAGELTPERLAELVQIALSASPGPWIENNDDGYSRGTIWSGMTPSGNGKPGALICEVVGDSAETDANAEFIEAFDPPTVLALIRTLQATQARLEEAAQFAKDVLDQCHVERSRAALAEQEASRRKAEAERAAGVPFEVTDKIVVYIAQYGGICRSCADEFGICPSSGLPCANVGKAIRSVLEALNYGVSHGFVALTSLRGDAT